MKISSQIVLFLVSIIFINCSSSDEMDEIRIVDFILQCNRMSYIADIDETAKTICINDLTDDKLITSVKYRLSEGTRISPLPEDIEEWKDGQKFVVTGKSGQTVEYTLMLPQMGEKPTETSKVVIGYLPLYSKDFDVRLDELNWELLTHVNVSFVHVKSDGTLNTGMVNESKLNRVCSIARKHGVKVLISINKNSDKSFADAIGDKERRNKLVRNIVNFTREKKLDGFDIDYEDYNNWDKTSLVAFAKALYEAKDRDMLMTCAVVCWLDYTTEWHRYFDYINIMSYDYVLPSSKEPGQPAPYNLFVRDLKYWMNKEAPKFKIVGGLPFCGYSWDKDLKPALSFNEILNHFSKTHDIESVADGDNINETYYNGRNTIRKKCKYIMDNDFGGVMIWQLFQDAYDREHSLIKVIEEEMR